MTASRLPSGAPVFGLFKQSYAAADHQGWVRLNGRTIATLTTKQQAVALGLGWVGNIPDATSRGIEDPGAGALYGTTTATAVTLTQANMPAAALTGGTLDLQTNNHTHGFNPQASPNFRRPAGGGQNPINNGGNGANQQNMVVRAGGPHSHNWNIPLGADAPFTVEAPYVSTNAFVFLGV